MFLFTKKTKNVVKWFWIVFASLIIVSMVVAYSGFAMLASVSHTPQPHEIPPEVLAQLEEQRNGTTSPEVQALIEQLQASGTVDVATPTIEREGGEPPISAPEALPEPTETEQPPVPQLQFDL